MGFFKEAFDWLANLSTKLPEIDFKTYFIVVVAVLAGVGLIVALTLLGSRSFKLKKASKKIVKYLGGVDSITEENVNDFTAQCFSAKAPKALRESWVQYLGVRFGYPSEIVSEQNVYDKQVKKQKDVRANVFIAIALVLVAAFAFWGFGKLESVEMGVIHCAGLLLSAIIYIVIVILTRVQAKKCLEAFDEMLEDLDSKVNLQVETSFAVDSSPLAELRAITDEIVARNTSKAVEIEDEEENDIPQTPIEQLIAEENEQVEEEPAEEVAEETAEEAEAPVEEEPVQEEEIAEPTEEPTEEATEEEQIEDPIEETAEEAEALVEEEPVQEEQAEGAEEPIAEEPTVEEEVEEPVEEAVEEPSQESVEEGAEEETEAPEDTVEEEPAKEEDVVYVVDGEQEEEEDVKPSKLVKLPNLIDYMMTKNFSRGAKIQIAGMLIGAYKKVEGNPQDRKIVVECLKKVMLNLQK